MNFRRQPFQFSTIDPVKRQAELQKRFGLPTTNSDMFVDFINPGMMGSGMREPSSLSGSPRLQHRVPVFTEKMKGNSEQNNVDSSHKPRVRVIPIQVEGVDGGKRHRNFSGPANIGDRNGEDCQDKFPETFPHPNSFKVDEQLKAPSQPKVCNIPIQVEPSDVKSAVDSNLPTTEPAKKLKAEVNGCAASSDKKKDPGVKSSSDKIKNLGVRSIPLKQIEDVLKKLRLYTEEVEKFTGTSKDRQYRYLDEMLTRCMLDLDNVDTFGLEDIRKARKEAVRQVQHYVDLLDTKVNEPVKKMDNSVDNLEQMICDIPAGANDTVNHLNSNESEELNKQCASSDVEMNSGALSEVNSASSQNNSDDTAEIVTGDVEMTEERLDHETTSDKLSAQNSSIENEQLENSKADLSPNQRADVSSSAFDIKMTDSKNKSDIVIEELDDSLENQYNVIDVSEAVSCVISDSPERDVTDTIIEEGDSEIVIEEVEDVKDVDHSSNACDSSVDKVDIDEKLSVGQIKSDICDVTIDKCVPMSQTDETVTEIL